MSASRLILVVSLLTCLLHSSVSKEVTVEPGLDVILRCQGPRDADIELLEWIKPDLESDDYVFFIRENQRYEDYQHPSFRGRVELRDPTMTDGDASVILKNVNIKDAGTYECHVGKRSSGRSKRSAPEHIHNITLKVEHTEHSANIPAKSGDRVILSCGDFRNTPITGVEWSRPDLEPAGYVFKSQNRRSVPDNQHPYFRNWVEPTEDGSLILKYAMNIDSGTYNCYVNQGGKQRRKRSINLTVGPGHTEEEGGER